MAGLVDMPTSWELPLATKNIVMQDERNFERSSPSWAVTFPRDLSLADDEGSSEFIKQVQTIMKGGPLGTFPYSGPIDGKITDHLIYTVIQFGWKLRDKTGKNIQMISGKTIVPSKFQEAMILLNKKDEENKKDDDDEIKEDDEPSSIIASFQKYFKTNGMYDGGTDGKPNDKELASLAAAAKKVEMTIADAISNKEVIGKLWDDDSKTFKTTVSDLKTALKLIIDNKNNEREGKKDAKLSKNDRFLILSYLNA